MRRFHSGPNEGLIALVELTVMVFIVGLVLAMPSMPARAQTPHLIEMTDYAFTPQFVTISTGDTVQWHNGGTAAHTATSNTSAWPDVVLSPGQTSAAITINLPGTYDYICSYHFNLDMWGAITAVGNPVAEFSSSAVIVAGMLAMAIGLALASRRRG